MKKLLCFVLCVLIAASAMAIIPASAASSSVIYFNAAGWKSFSKIYCHVYVIGGDSFFGWQTPSEECTKVSGTKYSYDLSKLKGSMDVSGGMKSGGKYGVIFSANIGIQSYDLTIGLDCAGDTAKLTENQIENPVDSNKKSYEAVWTNSSDKYGPHLALTSIGNTVGSKLAPGETGVQVIADWVSKYYNSPNVNAVNALAKAFPKFKIKTSSDLKNVYANCQANSELTSTALAKIKSILEKAYKKAYPDAGSDVWSEKINISKWTVKGIKTKTYTGKAIKQKITVTKNGKKATVKVSYSNNKNAGKAKMTIKGTGNYKGTIKKTFKIKKAANPVKVKTSVKLINHIIISYLDYKVKPITIKKAKGKLTFKKVSGSYALSVKSNGAIVVKQGAYSGLHTAKVKVTAKGNKNYNSKSKTVTVQIVVH